MCAVYMLNSVGERTPPCEVLLISSATLIVRAGGAIWLNHIATVLFTVYSAVNVECLYPCCVGVFGMFAVM